MQRLNWSVIQALAQRTFRQTVESPIAYVVAFFFYGLIGIFFGVGFFQSNQASIEGLSYVDWALWIVAPALTMGLISDEIKTGTFEQLSTLPVRDSEIVLGKFAGYAKVSLFVIGGLAMYPLIVSLLVQHPQHLDWGQSFGTLAGLYFLMLMYGSFGLYASSLAKNQVVAFIIGIILCTFFFFLGQLYAVLPGPLAQIADFFGVSSHFMTFAKGVWDIRDLLYFVSMTFVFLYLTVQRLSTRRF